MKKRLMPLAHGAIGLDLVVVFLKKSKIIFKRVHVISLNLISMSSEYIIRSDFFPNGKRQEVHQVTASRKTRLIEKCINYDNHPTPSKYISVGLDLVHNMGVNVRF